MGKKRQGLVTVNCKVAHAVARMSMLLNPSIAREASFTTTDSYVWWPLWKKVQLQLPPDAQAVS